MNYRYLVCISLTTLQISLPLNAYTNKTCMVQRPFGVVAARDITSFQALITQATQKNIQSTAQATAFYQASNNTSRIARYFLVHEKSMINLPLSATKDAGGDVYTTSLVTNDVDFGYINHMRDMDSAAAHVFNQATETVKLGLKPVQHVYGLTLNFHENLQVPRNDWYIFIHIPIVRVKNIITPTIVAGTYNNTDVSKQFSDFLCGEAAGKDYAKLTKAKLDGKRMATGVADVDLGLGCYFINNTRCNASLAIALTIPTGNKPTGDYVFEPVYGNGNHIGLGGDFTSMLRLVGSEQHHCALQIIGSYRYLLSNHEHRTLGIKNRMFGHYYLLGKQAYEADPGASKKPLIPAANILTLPVNVTPGNQIDAVCGLTYNKCGITADLGYNLYFREQEKVSLKNLFPDKTYALAARGFDTTTAFDLTAVDAYKKVDGGNVAAATINNTTIDVHAATTPELLTHAVYAGLGYISQEESSIGMIGIGGMYEIAQHNNALEQWYVWLKVGIGL